MAIELRPDNPAFEPIMLTADDEVWVAVMAEFVEVVATGEIGGCR